MNEARRRYVNLRFIGMSVFNKKEDADQEPVEKKAAEPTAGKGRPTPKRKDAPGAESPSAGSQGS